MEWLEMTGKTVEEAVNAALEKLGCERADTEINILEAGSKGILGFGTKLAKVVVKVKNNPERTAKNFLIEMIKPFGLDVEIETSIKDRQLLINMSGKDIGVLIGKRGQTLDALQYLVNLVVNKGDNPYISVMLDTENYRQRRKDTLESLALNLAKKSKQLRKNIVLEPMNPFERRIIHSFLQSDKYVSTFSEGEEPFRYVVITPSRNKGGFDKSTKRQ